MEQSNQSSASGRRTFFKKAGAVLFSAVAVLVPLASGIVVFFDPLRRKSSGNAGFVKVTSLNSIPDDGVPRKFPVLTDLTDAWNHSTDVPVGAVYLRRPSGGKVEAFNVVCPHAGCFVDFVAARRGFVCPCHNSLFALDGAIADPKSPSPRGLDRLSIEIRKDSEVWVKFENFRAGIKERVPV
jgi:menaquinol-cytochrome c reductase iron-sulfur subunit